MKKKKIITCPAPSPAPVVMRLVERDTHPIASFDSDWEEKFNKAERLYFEEREKELNDAIERDAYMGEECDESPNKKSHSKE